MIAQAEPTCETALKPYFDDGGGRVIYLGDAREILPQLDQRFDLVLTDPPYGVSLGDKRRTNGMTKHGNEGYSFDDDRGYVEKVCVPVIELCRDLATRTMLTPGLKNLWCYPEPDALWGIYFANGAGVGRWKAFTCWQPILCYGPTPTYNGSQPDTFATTDQAERNGHPCPKPLAVWRRIMNRIAAQTILDPFMGSGTTLVAAKLEGRSCVGIELVERFAEIAANRLSQGVLF